MNTQYNIVGVVGAGAMGRGIAQIAAQAGSRVLLFDNSPTACEKAIAAVHEQWDKLAAKGRLTPEQVQANKSHLQIAAALDEAVGVLEKAARATLDKAGLTEADIDWLIPHQANIRIMQSTARRLKLPMDKVVVTVDQHGNTSAASIPLALDHAVRAGQVKKGETLLLEGVGGGFTWGAVLLDL